MFSEIIDKASEIASAPFTEDSQHYEILLIITDGVVNDKMLTVKKYEASHSDDGFIVLTEHVWNILTESSMRQFFRCQLSLLE